MDKITDEMKNEDEMKSAEFWASKKALDEIVDELLAVPGSQFSPFADVDSKIVEKYHCNLRKEPWEIKDKLSKTAVDFSAQDLKRNAAQEQDNRTIDL